jgi:hypothetical protein
MDAHRRQQMPTVFGSGFGFKSPLSHSALGSTFVHPPLFAAIVLLPLGRRRHPPGAAASRPAEVFACLPPPQLTCTCAWRVRAYAVPRPATTKRSCFPQTLDRKSTRAS